MKYPIFNFVRKSFDENVVLRVYVDLLGKKVLNERSRHNLRPIRGIEIWELIFRTFEVISKIARSSIKVISKTFFMNRLKMVELLNLALFSKTSKAVCSGKIVFEHERVFWMRAFWILRNI